MELRRAGRIGGELIEIFDREGRCVVEIRCNDPAYADQVRELAASVRHASGVPAGSPAARLLSLVRDAG